jgi:hypothetical protein
MNKVDPEGDMTPDEQLADAMVAAVVAHVRKVCGPLEFRIAQLEARLTNLESLSGR